MNLPPSSVVMRCTIGTRTQYMNIYMYISVYMNTYSYSYVHSFITLATTDKLGVFALKRPANNRDAPRSRTLADIIGVYSGGPHGRRKEEAGHTQDKYLEFLDFIE
jgi:hypothetical protein